MRQPILILALLATAAPRTAAAQRCIGQPMAHARAGLERNDAGTMTAAIGVRTGETGALAVNAANPDDAPNGSTTYSFGGRAYYGRESRSGWGLCVLTGVQIGRAHLINADGLRMNARIKSSSIPIALGVGRSIPAAGAIRLVVFGKPQVLLQSRSMTLYDRSDTTSTSEFNTRFGWEAGVSLLLGPVRVSASTFHIKDLPSGWTIGGGVAW